MANAARFLEQLIDPIRHLAGPFAAGQQVARPAHGAPASPHVMIEQTWCTVYIVTLLFHSLSLRW